MCKLLVTDIDGTITHCAHRLESAVVDKLCELQAMGWEIFFITGRYFSYAHRLLGGLPIPFLLGCQNGSSIWSSEKKKFLFNHGIPSHLLTKIEAHIQGHPVIFAVESGAPNKDYYYRSSPKGLEPLQSMLDSVYFPDQKSKSMLIEAEVISSEYCYPLFAAAKVFGKRRDIETVAKSIRQEGTIASELTIDVMRWPFDLSYGILFMTQRQVSKGYAVQRVIDTFYQGVQPFVMASGDDVNDIPLLAKGNFKIVMASAPKEMLALADFIAPPAKDLGIITAWDRGEQFYQENNRNKK